MRTIPFLTAVLVVAGLYMLIVERDALLGWAQGEGLSVEDLLTPGPAESETAEERLAALTRETPGPADEQSDEQADAAAIMDAAGEDGGADAAPARTDAPLVRVVAMHSSAREIDSAVVLRGETEALRQVDVAAETSGRVISEPLRKGSFVEKDEVLCKLDPGTREIRLSEAQARKAEAEAKLPEAKARLPEAEARVEQARAQLEEAEINYNAATKLSEGGFASETRVASARAAVRSAEAGVQTAMAGVESAKSGMKSVGAAIQAADTQVAAAEREIELLTVTAPFAGLLETDTAEYGALLQAQGPSGALCATVIQLNPIKLVGFVPETEVSRIEVGARAGARLATGGERVMGQVTFLSRSADETTRTFRVEIEVPNPDLAIRDGQTAEIGIEADGAMAHMLPQSALTLNDEGLLGVRLVSGESTAQFYEVSLMRDTVNGVWVTGLPDQADVITVGQEYVTDGVPIEATYREATQ